MAVDGDSGARKWRVPLPNVTSSYVLPCYLTTTSDGTAFLGVSTEGSGAGYGAPSSPETCTTIDTVMQFDGDSGELRQTVDLRDFEASGRDLYLVSTPFAVSAEQPSVLYFGNGSNTEYGPGSDATVFAVDFAVVPAKLLWSTPGANTTQVTTARCST